jgi:hypothetical protein
MTCATRSRRLRTPVLSKIDLMWSLTVYGDRWSSAPIAFVDAPRSTSRATSHSRGVSPCELRTNGAVRLG